ncbi:TPA: hypothetical protein ACVS3C_002661 [Enterobacter hormaechei]|uniref:hypothetical protein n=1 Tax=Enterobacter cloacae complex TaxID=354276 RepID=UPI0005F97B82|nr:hypothetical protein [Enterobacter hormaechei]EHN8837947.1 hypothetical protein [Enterobacter hormaechei]EKS6330288.1 hypothetical protein [Enterobacter hormaechei]EKS6510084.1 hypothetical protein [Enterobacter hormaechei]EKT4032651.1 hypothetical protein [Enterobacter hormaechei]EKZ1442136.1 hypothetical protein [Enterobacter hormaechei]
MSKWRWRVLSALYIAVLAVATYYAMYYIQNFYDKKIIPWAIAAMLVILFSSLSTISRDMMNELDKNSSLNTIRNEKDAIISDLEQKISSLQSKLTEKDNILHAFKSSFTGSFVSCADEKELVIRLKGLATKMIDNPEMNNLAPAGTDALALMMKLR